VKSSEADTTEDTASEHKEKLSALHIDSADDIGEDYDEHGLLYTNNGGDEGADDNDVVEDLEGEIDDDYDDIQNADTGIHPSRGKAKMIDITDKENEACHLLYSFLKREEIKKGIRAEAVVHRLADLFNAPFPVTRNNFYTDIFINWSHRNRDECAMLAVSSGKFSEKEVEHVFQGNEKSKCLPFLGNIHF
jgi:hypothetical protein